MREVEPNGGSEVGSVDRDLDKDVESLDGGGVDGDCAEPGPSAGLQRRLRKEGGKLTEAAVAVVHHHIASERPRGVVVDAASAIGDISHDGTLCSAEALDNVDDGAAVHEQPLGHLQRDASSAILLDLSDGFGDLKVVVGW